MSPDAGELLEGLGLPGPWRLDWPEKGVTGRTVYAHGPDGHRVVVKFAAAPPCHSRLSELGVASRVLATGHDGTQPFHVQSHLDGTARTWAWVGEHLDQVVALVARYATDAELTRQLRLLDQTSTLASHRAGVWDATMAHHADARDSSLLTAEVTDATARLAAALADDGDTDGKDGDADLVPSHTDVNNTNVILLRDGGLALVDWDGLCLSDPARDLGTLLWWYSARPDFDAAWSALGLDHETWPGLTRRAHWWAAVTSLRAALWNDQRGADPAVIASFVEDLVAAADGRANPKQHGSTMPVLS